MSEDEIGKFLEAIQGAPEQVERFAMGQVVRFEGSSFEVISQPYFDSEYILLADIRPVGHQGPEYITVPVKDVTPVSSLEVLGEQAE